MSSYFHKPENALRRAVELQSIDQPDAALSLLHDALASRRHKTWSPTYESIMIAYLNLCLRLNRSREAKDGLHQYRNLSQHQAPGSLENVIRHLIDNAELRCKLAKEKADAGKAAVVEEVVIHGDVDDLDAGSTPQSILLSTMNVDPEQTQRETSLLLPQLKFLWETYRAVLDILRSNSKLEHLYHSAALGALRFCETYRRKTEFRRLCDMLRQHLGNLQKYGNVPPGGTAVGPDGKSNNKLRGWEGWTPESIELHLQTRFAQLEAASALELYTEGFRTTEDIYSIMQISKRTPKARLMATYYEKLIGIFWVSENLLFHAFAWYKYYTLCREYNKSMSDEAKVRQASCVLLAALCIPTIGDGGTGGGTGGRGTASGGGANNKPITTVEDDIAKEKTARMATLLGFQTHPTREALLAELRAKNLLADVPPHLRELYHLVEQSGNPLTMVERARPLLEKLREDGSSANGDFGSGGGATASASSPDLTRYVRPLVNVLLFKLLYNLSVTYHTVSLDHLRNLTDDGLGLDFEEVEKGIVLATRQRIVSCKIDHQARCLRFGDAGALEGGALRGHMKALAVGLDRIVSSTPEMRAMMAAGAAPEYSAGILAERRHNLFEGVRDSIEAEHAAMLERKVVIEKRKEEAERREQERLKEELRIKAEEERLRKEEEARRLDWESKRREKEKHEKIKKELELLEKKKYEKLIGMDEGNLEAKTVEELAEEHKRKITKEKEEAERKLKEAAKRLDYIVRAIRIEELPMVREQFEERSKADRERYEKETVEKAKRARMQWEENTKQKKTLETHRVFNFTKGFEELVMKDRHVEHEAACREAEKIAEIEAEKDKKQRAYQRKEEEAKRKAEEEARRIAEEEQRRAEEERARREEEMRKKKAEEEERRKAEITRMQEEQLKKAREREAAQPPPPSGGFDSLPSAGGDRPAPAASGKYVPPSRRGAGGGMGPGGSDRRGGGGGFDDRRGGGYGGGRYDRGGDSRFGDRGGDSRFGDRGGDSRFGDRGGDSRFGDRGGDSRFGDRDGDRGGDSRFGDRGGDGRYGDRGGDSRFGDRGGDSRFADRGDNRYGDRDRGGDSRYGDRDRGGSRYDRPGDRDRYGDRDRDRDRRSGPTDSRSSRW